MRIAHVTTDEVNHAVAVQAARPLGATMTQLNPQEMSRAIPLDAVLYDLNSAPPDRQLALVDELRAERTNRPTAVYGYCLSEEQAQELRYRGVAVAQRLHAALIRTLANAVRQNLAAVPPDDATTELTWINVSA
jgi:hypothetical protein